MKSKVVAGLSPDKIPELKTALEAQGWNVVQGQPTPEAMDKTVFLTDTVPDIVDDYDVLSVGLNISQNQDAAAIVDMILNQSNPLEKAKEPVVIEEKGAEAEGPDQTPEPEPNRDIIDPAKEVRKAERNDRQMAFLLS